MFVLNIESLMIIDKINKIKMWFEKIVLQLCLFV